MAGGGQDVVIGWNGISNRVYQVLWTPAMTGGWNHAGTVSNVPGSNGWLSFTDHVDGVHIRFYRINVKEP
jgi:hypothetical protein